MEKVRANPNEELAEYGRCILSLRNPGKERLTDCLPRALHFFLPSHVSLLSGSKTYKAQIVTKS